VLRLKDLARSALSWRSIVDDIDQERLVLDTLQVKQARQQKDDAEQTLRRALRDTYRWLLNPSQELRKGRPETTLHWEAVALSASAPSLSEEIQRQLRDNEWLVTEWSPIHLANLLRQWYFRDGTTEVGALRVWEDCCNYLYFPRVVNAEVFQRTVQDGLASEDFFGYASGRDGDKYLGFCFGQSRWPSLDHDALLIEREASSAYRQRIAPPPAVSATAEGFDETLRRAVRENCRMLKFAHSECEEE
jgi:uncharacterized protein